MGGFHDGGRYLLHPFHFTRKKMILCLDVASIHKEIAAGCVKYGYDACYDRGISIW